MAVRSVSCSRSKLLSHFDLASLPSQDLNAHYRHCILPYHLHNGPEPSRQASLEPTGQGESPSLYVFCFNLAACQTDVVDHIEAFAYLSRSYDHDNLIVKVFPTQAKIYGTGPRAINLAAARQPSRPGQPAFIFLKHLLPNTVRAQAIAGDFKVVISTANAECIRRLSSDPLAYSWLQSGQA